MQTRRQTTAFVIAGPMLLYALSFAHTAMADDDVVTLPTAASTATLDYDPDADEALYLLVSINGRDVGLIAEFALSLQSSRMSAQRSELEGIGIAAPHALGSIVFLDEIPEFAFVYDVPSQSILITAQGATLISVEISARPQTDLPASQSGVGLLLNYRATVNLGDDFFSDGFEAKQTFVALDMRAYAPFGVLTSTGALALALDDADPAEFTRYDTFFTISSPSRIITMTAGDITTSGLAWTRPVRLGGLQIRRDFSLRNDVVTSPLLSFSGAAAVPSSIDVYVDNIRAYSGSVPAGPFNLSDVPMITSGGEAVFILRDAGGNEQTSTVAFYATQDLLSAGTFDFALEVGKPRTGYGGPTTSYATATARSVSLRYGLSDRLTLGGHAEAVNDLRMGGFGLDVALFNRAELTLAGGASVNRTAQGLLFFGALRTEVAGVGLRFSTRRTFGNFQDLASDGMRSLADDSEAVINPSTASTARDALSLTFPMVGNDGTMGVTLVHVERAGLTGTILSMSYAQPLPWAAASFQINGFHDLAGDGSTGVSVGLSMPLGPKGYASANLRQDRSGQLNTTASLSRMADRSAGSYGYRADLSEQSRALAATYQTAHGRADLGLRDTGQGTRASATFEGALVLSGGGVFAGNRITDSFAIVDVGVPDIPVSLNNREVARTGASGKTLLSDLQSYRINRVSVDPLALPLDSYLDATAMNVVPARRAGVMVNLRGKSGTAALVVIRDTAGNFLTPGTMIRLTGTQQDFAVGYDGEVWIEGLGARNRITARTDGTTCQAEFTFTAQQGAQVYIEGVECR
ncbi:MAG: fimbrial biogenesis outer membrane usher protein [Loktanella sp.]|nr:fimbrial biogenesis outer membrane usher protein [Loktanella sp.]